MAAKNYTSVENSLGSVADALLDIHAAEGFRPFKVEGVPGKETITLTNDRGVERVIKCGMSPIGMRLQNRIVSRNEMTPVPPGKIIIKMDWSDKQIEE